MIRLTFRPFDLAFFDRHVEAFLSIAADVPGEYWAAENFRRPLPEKLALSFVVCDGDQPIGYAILSRQTPPGIHLHHFMVAAPYRSKGLGARMIEQIVERAVRARAPEITLKANSPRAESFYRRYGFVMTGEENGYRLYRRRLAAPNA